MNVTLGLIATEYDFHFIVWRNFFYVYKFYFPSLLCIYAFCLFVSNVLALGGPYTIVNNTSVLAILTDSTVFCVYFSTLCQKMRENSVYSIGFA